MSYCHMCRQSHTLACLDQRAIYHYNQVDNPNLFYFLYTFRKVPNHFNVIFFVMIIAKVQNAIKFLLQIP